MAPDKKPGHGEKAKSPDKKPVPDVKPDQAKKTGMPAPQAKPSGPTKR